MTSSLHSDPPEGRREFHFRCTRRRRPSRLTTSLSRPVPESTYLSLFRHIERREVVERDFSLDHGDCRNPNMIHSSVFISRIVTRRELYVFGKITIIVVVIMTIRTVVQEVIFSMEVLQRVRVFRTLDPGDVPSLPTSEPERHFVGDRRGEGHL